MSDDYADKMKRLEAKVRDLTGSKISSSFIPEKYIPPTYVIHMVFILVVLLWANPKFLRKQSDGRSLIKITMATVAIYGLITFAIVYSNKSF